VRTPARTWLKRTTIAASVAGLGVLAAPGGTAFADPTAAAESPAASAAAEAPGADAVVQVVANPDVGSFNGGAGALVNVLANDIGPDGAPSPFPGEVGVDIQGAAGKGTATVRPNGDVTYQPGVCASGSTSFTYVLVDTAVTTNRATGRVTINIANRVVPVRASNDAFTVRDDGTAVGNLLANDCAGARNLLQLSQGTVRGPSRGRVIINSADGSFVYSRNSADRAGGTDSFKYLVRNRDNAGLTATATVTLRLPAITVPAGSVTPPSDDTTPDGAGGVVPPGTEDTGQLGNIALPPPVQAPQLPQPQLPATGTDVLPIALTGAGLVLAGSAAVFITRRRREPVATEVVAAD
jgi:LPXTG-motif cell wall-anchored protein